MSISVQKTDPHTIAVGGTVSQEQVEALDGISIGTDDILDNMELLNEELSETYALEESAEVVAQTLPQTTAPTPPPRNKARKQIKTATQRVPRSVSRVGSDEARAEIIEEKKRSTMPVQETVTHDSLDAELAALEQQLTTLKGTQPVATDTSAEGLDVGDGMREQIMELLGNTEGAPTEAQIAKWKIEYGENGVHVLALGEGDVYIFTHLKRGQWKKIQEVIAKMQEAGSAGTDLEDTLKEKVVQHSVLWPRPLTLEFFYNSRAGVMDSLYQVILLNSYFLTPQQAMLLTTSL